tara:strand:+ start:245 stop:1306 length:1062 start_codon:yes stop_codon:yes gene_type:complete
MGKKFSEKWKEEREKKRAMKKEKQGQTSEPVHKHGATLEEGLKKTEQKIDLNIFNGRHLFVATPAYGGLVGEAYLKSMVKLGIIFKQYNLNFTLATIANESLITRGRNTLVSMFMAEPKFTDMIFIDADIHFEAESILKLWSKLCNGDNEVDIVVGSYPKKMINWKGIRNVIDRDNIPAEEMERHQASYVLNIKADPDGRIPMRNGLIPVYDAGTGFMMYKRSVIQKMMDKWPDLHYKNDLNTDAKFDPYMYALFDTIIDPTTRRYLSEDYTFCRRWQELGGTIWMDPSIDLDHQGTHLFRGNISNQFSYGGPAIPGQNIVKEPGKPVDIMIPSRKKKEEDAGKSEQSVQPTE